MKSLGIKSKLLIAFAATAFISVAVGGVSSYYSSRVTSTYRSIAQENLPNFRTFIDMKANMSLLIVPVAGLVNTSSTPTDAAKAKAEAETNIADFEKAAKKYEANPFAPGEEKVWNDFKTNHWKPFVDMTMEMIRLSGTNNKEDQKLRDKLWETDYAEKRKSRVEAFDHLLKFQLDDADQTEMEGERLDRQMNVIMVSIVALGFLAAILLGYIIASYLSRELNSVADALANGSTEVSSAVSQLSSASEELSTASSQQAASVQETAASLEEINAMVQKNAQSASESAQVSNEAKAKAENGKHAVERMARSMDDIRQSNQNIQAQIEDGNKKIAEIIHVIQEIGNKTKVINDIVFQTKLLSFNASVEAARAGEHGKGFAVVAEEVGNLAQMSGSSAKDITSLLEVSIKKVESVVSETQQKTKTLMVQALDTVQTGSNTAGECGHTLEEIVGNVQRLSEMVAGISSASQEQTRGVEEISKAVQEIDQATQSNASAAQQTSTSAHQLTVQVSTLQAASEKLRLIVDGKAVKQSLSAPTSTKTNVLALKPTKVAVTEPTPATPPPFKKTTGSHTVPEENDVRFEDVG